MKHSPSGIQAPQADNQKMEAGDSDPGSAAEDLQGQIQSLRRDLENTAETIDSLTAALTSRDIQISAIVNSRAWRWVNRYSRIKRGYLVPAYEFLRDLPGKGRKRSVNVSPTSRKVSSTPARTLADVVCFSNMEWDFRYQRPQQIMSQFAAHGHRVFYLRPERVLPLSCPERFSLIALKENLYQVTLAARREVWINQEDIQGANAEVLLDSLDALRQAYDIENAIGYVMSPSWTSTSLEAKSRWGWSLIYDCMDEWNGFPGMSHAISRAERSLVRECDLLVVTAERLYEKWRGIARALTLSRNAVDYQFYAERCRPNTFLKDEPHPVVGYFGAIAEWFDVGLVAHLARQRPDYTFVLLGRIAGADISELQPLPNVRLLGQHPYETMPQYLYHFDACLIPFKITRTTEATDPVKVYEYLSSGKPVVSVDLPELKSFSDLLYIGADRDHFLEQLDNALSEGDPELAARRRAFAAGNTWKHRYETILAGVGNALDKGFAHKVLQTANVSTHNASGPKGRE
jgi:glycosyltransferase involved in cell wall biosynthesis